MSDTIIGALIGAGSALIVGILAFIGVVITNRRSNAEMIKTVEVNQAVTNTKIEELTREVREHNNFAQRMPVVEKEIEHIGKDMEHLGKDISKLQKFHESTH